MALITADELARGAILVTCGGGAGSLALAAPGSALWLIPAVVGVISSALTVPEVRDEVLPAVRRATPLLTDGARRAAGHVKLLAAPKDKGAPAVVTPAAPTPPPPDAVSYPGGAAFTPQPESARARRRDAVLTPDQFADDPLFRTLNEEPHALVIGHTRGGKTTAMHGMVQAWAAQGHEVFVIDPDAASGSWPGASTVAGYAEDYDGIGRVVDRLQAIFDERSDLYADGHRDFPPLHIVADEVHETIRNVPGARDFLFETVGRRGAKRGMFLALGTQGNNVDELGLDSAGVLNNFITAELEKNEKGRRVATVYRGNAARKKRVQQFAVPALTPARDFVRPSPVTEARQLPLPQPTPATYPTTRTTTNLRVPEPDSFLAELLQQQLLATMSPERAARLRATLAQPAAPVEPPPTAQTVTVDRGDGGHVTVNVMQSATPAGRGRAGRGGVDVQARRRRMAYQQAARDGIAFNEAYRRLGGNRNEMSKIFNAAKPA